MLVKTGPNAVKSSEGYQVAIVKRFELSYEDEFGKRTVPIEPMADGELVVSVSSAEGERRAVLSARISEALDYLGIRHRLD